MALTQFNDWEPKLDGLEGNFQAEPRVFVHDAITASICGINDSHPTHGITMTSGGINYAVNDRITIVTGTGFGAVVGDRAVLVVTDIDAATGAITNYDFSSHVDCRMGAKYIIGASANEQSTTGGGSGFTATVANTDIPNTQKRGCCLYVGGGGDIEITLESGNTVTMAGVVTGSFMPVLAKSFVITALANNTTATNMLALY